MLGGVSLGEEGILTFVFAVVYLSLNKGGNDNDVSSASRYGSLQHIGRHTNVAAVFGQGGNKNLYNEKIAGEAKDMNFHYSAQNSEHVKKSYMPPHLIHFGFSMVLSSYLLYFLQLESLLRLWVANLWMSCQSYLEQTWLAF
ncbi:unnamed protein product [Lactuca saligna]|uniref:Uncharacterized protein n=1 Tax=Lactuca saligna TaxID=75948 RepID=A0AA35Z3R4_LACSI|nr:unnamed protein product [Lactuca saligna]